MSYKSLAGMLDSVDVATALYWLAALTVAGARELEVIGPVASALRVEASNQALSAMPNMGPRSVASCMWAASRLTELEPSQQDNELLEAGWRRVQASWEGFEDRHLAVVAAAVARSGLELAPREVAALVEAAKTMLGTFTPSNLTELMGALVDLRHRPTDVFLADAAQHIQSCLSLATPRDMAGLARAFAFLGAQNHCAFLQAFQTQFLKRIARPAAGILPRDLCLLLWACATAEQLTTEAFSVYARKRSGPSC